jgi:histone H3/H4
MDPIAAISFLFIVWVIAESYASEGDSKKSSSTSEGDFVDLIFSLLVSPIMLVVGALLLLGGGLLLLFPLFLGMLSLIGVAMKSLFSVVRTVLRKTWSLAKAMVRGIRRLWRISVGSGRIIRAVLGFPLRVVKGLYRLVRSIVRSVRSVAHAFLKTVRGLWKTAYASFRLLRGVVRILHSVIRTLLRIVRQVFKFLSSVVRSVRSILRKVLRMVVMFSRKAIVLAVRLVRWMVIRIAKFAIRSAGQIKRVTVETNIVRKVSQKESGSSRPFRRFLSQESVADRHTARVREESSMKAAEHSQGTEYSQPTERGRFTESPQQWQSIAKSTSVSERFAARQEAGSSEGASTDRGAQPYGKNTEGSSRSSAAGRSTSGGRMPVAQYQQNTPESRRVNGGVRTRWSARQETGVAKDQAAAGTRSAQERKAAGRKEEEQNWNEQPEIMGTLRTIGWNTRHKIYPRRK